MAKKLKKREIDKLITLPKETVEGLDKLAEKERMTTKPYMEKILINHEVEKNKK